jgi:hypothetical protein
MGDAAEILRERLDPLEQPASPSGDLPGQRLPTQCCAQSGIEGEE